MAKVEKTVTINAPVEKIFNYVSDPTNLPEFWPSLVEISDVKTLSNGGHSNRWVYKMAGIRLQGTSEDVEYVKNQRLVSKTKGGTESTQTWSLHPVTGGTRVTFTVEYTVPIPVLGKVVEAVALRWTDREADTATANIKARMEA